MTNANTPQDDTAGAPAPDHSGPFSVSPVDPLVFRQTTDTPEMRAAAAYIPAASRRLELPIPAPTAPASRTYSDWTPAAAPTATGTAGTAYDELDTVAATGTPGQRKLRQMLLTALIMAVPFTLIAAAVWFGLTLTTSS